MAENFVNGFQHISLIVGEASREIHSYRTGEKIALKTPYKKLNDTLGGGLFPGDQVVIAGRSSVGKSAVAVEVIAEIANSHPDCIILFWSLEMASWRNIIRMLSSNMNLTVKELLSARGPLSDEKFAQMQHLGEILSKLPIYFRDIAVTAEKWEEMVLKVQVENPGKLIINMLDHTRLVLPGMEKIEERIISNLMLAGVRVKNTINCINIFLSQLNRKIEEVDRKDVGTTGLLASYIFGADSVFQCADIVIGLHRPEMYGLKEFKKIPTKDLLIMQIMKQRDGEVCELAFKHQLMFNKILNDE